MRRPCDRGVLRAWRVRWGGRVPRPTHGHRLGAGPTGAPATVLPQHGPLSLLYITLVCSFPVLFSSCPRWLPRDMLRRSSPFFVVFLS